MEKRKQLLMAWLYLNFGEQRELGQGAHMQTKSDLGLILSWYSHINVRV